VFHCEFSEWRGPTAARRLIGIHRLREHPSHALHVVVMDGGFSKFYPSYTELCEGKYRPERRPTRAKPDTHDR
jgi:hypothetical protein